MHLGKPSGNLKFVRLPGLERGSTRFRGSKTRELSSPRARASLSLSPGRERARNAVVNYKFRRGSIRIIRNLRIARETT